MGVEQWSANRTPSARKGEVCAFLSQETSKQVPSLREWYYTIFYCIVQKLIWRLDEVLVHAMQDTEHIKALM